MLRKGLFVLVAAVIGAGCVWLEDYGTRALERMLIDRTEHGLTVIEPDWAYMHADGLRLELHGHAPDFFARDLALESARSTAPLAVIIDHTTFSLAPPPHRAPVRVELLRDSNGLTLTGRFHGEPMRRDSVIAALGTAAPGLIVDDLTRVNAARPDRWGPELEMATLAATRIPNAYVIVEPGAVQVRELVRDAAHRREASAALLALAGDGVRLDLRLREPLQVAAPFAFAAVKDETGAVRLEACAARGSDKAAVLEMALKRHGVDPGEVQCPAALGGPSGDWATAVATGLEALDRIAVEPEPYWIRLRRAGATVELSGLSADATARRLVESYAAAAFGQAAVRPALSLGGVGVPAAGRCGTGRLYRDHGTEGRPAGGDGVGAACRGALRRGSQRCGPGAADWLRPGQRRVRRLQRRDPGPAGGRLRTLCAGADRDRRPYRQPGLDEAQPAPQP